MNKTKKDYEEMLNSISYDLPDESYIVAGVYRRYWKGIKKYGTMLRKYDPIAFEVGYRDWFNEQLDFYKDWDSEITKDEEGHRIEVITPKVYRESREEKDITDLKGE